MALTRQRDRWTIRAQNEGGNNETLVDLWDLLHWLQSGPPEGRTDGGFRILAVVNSEQT